jgi:hypothetical protein
MTGQSPVTTTGSAPGSGHTGAEHDHHHHLLGPSGTGTVMVDIGGDIGALVIYTGPECHGWEIEISPEGAHRPPRTHAAVRKRYVRDGVLFSAVYTGLPAGRYVIWRDDTTPVDRVTVDGGTITEFHLDT